MHRTQISVRFKKIVRHVSTREDKTTANFTRHWYVPHTLHTWIFSPNCLYQSADQTAHTAFYSFTHIHLCPPLGLSCLTPIRLNGWFHTDRVKRSVSVCFWETLNLSPPCSHTPIPFSRSVYVNLCLSVSAAQRGREWARKAEAVRGRENGYCLCKRSQIQVRLWILH